MTVFTRSFFFRWACFLVTIGAVHAENTPPPVLPNPSACGLHLFITEAGCGPANEFPINVAAAPGTSMGGNVYLKELRFVIDHGWVADLDIFLKSPSGKIVEISTDNGDAFDNYGDPNDTTCSAYTSFVSHAVANACNLLSIKDGNAPFLGSYLPEGNFSDFNDGSSPIGQWTLMICDDGASNLGYLEFVELVFEATDCVAPTQVAVLQEDSTSVSLDWVTGSTCDDIIVEFGPVGFTPGTGATPGMGGTVVIGHCPPFVLTGLLPTTTYDIYLRENCGSNHFSQNACPVQAMTTCSPPPATIVEDFNAQQLCQPLCGVNCPITGTWRNASNDNFDWLVNQDTTLTALTGPPGDFPGGGKYVYLEASGNSCRNGRRAVLISNCIQVVANADSCDMSFDYNFHGVHINGMSLEISTNGGQTWAVLWNASGNKGINWHKKFIDLDAYSGMTAQFRFVGRGGSGQFADLALDNIVFYGSTDLGFPDFVNYLDTDGDGYGNPDFFIASCQPASFTGYVPNADDCDDSDFFINPGMEESLCDGLDANCNGDADEYFVAPVVTESQVICSGSNGYVVAFPANFGQISWYDSLTGGQIIAVGDTLFPDPSSLVNNGTDTLVLQFYAEELTMSGCLSNER
ncbi:MAG: proprotein convertase P-domain-containing protein, partial [Saprospiraceae bacterium]|nr:proprotein convertase P-domain-containing protein [Saprospiraceae bacterium]